MKYIFSVVGEGDADVRNITQVLVAANAANGGMGTRRVTVPSNSMDPGSSFTISLKANNFLGFTNDAYSNTKSATVKKSGNPAPVIRIQGDNPLTTATHSSELRLQASAELPTMTCVSSSLANAKMVFLWKETSGKLGMSSDDFAATSKNPRTINIAAGELVSWLIKRFSCTCT